MKIFFQSKVLVIIIPLSGKACELEEESKNYFHNTLQI